MRDCTSGAGAFGGRKRTLLVIAHRIGAPPLQAVLCSTLLAPGPLTCCWCSAAGAPHAHASPTLMQTASLLRSPPAPDTIMDCDQLLVLSAGHLVEQGAPGGKPLAGQGAAGQGG